MIAYGLGIDDHSENSDSFFGPQQDNSNNSSHHNRRVFPASRRRDSNAYSVESEGGWSSDEHNSSSDDDSDYFGRKKDSARGSRHSAPQRQSSQNSLKRRLSDNDVFSNYSEDDDIDHSMSTGDHDDINSHASSNNNNNNTHNQHNFKNGNPWHNEENVESDDDSSSSSEALAPMPTVNLMDDLPSPPKQQHISANADADASPQQHHQKQPTFTTKGTEGVPGAVDDEEDDDDHFPGDDGDDSRHHHHRRRKTNRSDTPIPSDLIEEFQDELAQLSPTASKKKKKKKKAGSKKKKGNNKKKTTITTTQSPNNTPKPKRQSPSSSSPQSPSHSRRQQPRRTDSSSVATKTTMSSYSANGGYDPRTDPWAPRMGMAAAAGSSPPETRASPPSSHSRQSRTPSPNTTSAPLQRSSSQRSRRSAHKRSASQRSNGSESTDNDCSSEVFVDDYDKDSEEINTEQQQQHRSSSSSSKKKRRGRKTTDDLQRSSSQKTTMSKEEYRGRGGGDSDSDDSSRSTRGGFFFFTTKDMETAGQKIQCLRLGLFCALVLVAALLGALIAVAVNRDDQDPAPSPTAAPTTQAPTSAPTLSPVPAFVTNENLFELVSLLSADAGAAIQEVGSPQHQAYLWLQNNDTMSNGPVQRVRRTLRGPLDRRVSSTLSNDRVMQRFRLAAFFYGTNGPTDWIRHANTWLNGSVSECEWQSDAPGGLLCSTSGMADVVTHLEFWDNNITGTLVPELGDMTDLKTLVLFQGGMTGSIPESFRQLIHLEKIQIVGHSLNSTVAGNQSSLPDDLLAYWSSANVIDLSQNQLTGNLGANMTLSTRLKELDLSHNQLTTAPAETPAESDDSSGDAVEAVEPEDDVLLTILFLPASSTSSLRVLKLNDNQLSRLPNITAMPNLTHLDVSNNNGEQALSMPLNYFNGTGSDLRILFLANNDMQGELARMASLTSLVQLDVSGNPQLTGVVPDKPVCDNIRQASSSQTAGPDAAFGKVDCANATTGEEAISTPCNQVATLCCSCCQCASATGDG